MTTTKIFGQCDNPECDSAFQSHEAEYHHEGQFGEGPIYIVTCPKDGLATFVTTEGLVQS